MPGATVDEELYRRYSMPVGEMAERMRKGIFQKIKVSQYIWSDGSSTWCADCGYCVGDERWVIHHSVQPLDDLLAVHLATHDIGREPPKVEGISWSAGVGYMRAACQQCGWEKDIHNETRWHPELVMAAKRHFSTTHLPTGGHCSAEGCECGDKC